jgi:radical SAM-linked protein
MVRNRVRIRFSKRGDLRLISHRDLLRTWERLFRRAQIRLCQTEGFHPKPKMMFPSALAVGIEGWNEVLEIELPRPYSADELTQAITPQLPPGLELVGIELLPEAARKARVRTITFEVDVPPDRRPSVAERIEWLLSQTSHEIQRDRRAKPLDLRPLIEELRLIEGTLVMRLRVDGDGSARPREVLAALGLDDVESRGEVIRRTVVDLIPDEITVGA